MLTANGYNLTDVTVDHNTLQSWVSSGPTTRLTLSNNQMTGVMVISDATAAVVTNNVINSDATAYPAGYSMYFGGGSNNQILQNTLSGGYDGSAAYVGMDDGVILVNETGDTIRGNTFSNFYDAAIEGASQVTNTTLAANTITNVGVAGIASYWCTDWSGNVVQANVVSQAPHILYAEYSVGRQCNSSISPANFTGNSIVGNQIRNPASGTSVPGGPPRSLYVLFTAGSVSGNVIQGNDFDTNDCPWLNPAQGFIDGGGNVGGSPDPAVPSNFTCPGGGALRALADLFQEPRRR